MRFLLILLFLNFIPFIIIGQDLIIKKNGKEINCEVLDQSLKKPSDISFRFGPTIYGFGLSMKF